MIEKLRITSYNVCYTKLLRIGYMGISQLIGSACAPAVGLAIATAFGMKETFIAAAALPALTCVLLFFMKDLHQPKPALNPRRWFRCGRARNVV